jgi:hypothetical protein
MFLSQSVQQVQAAGNGVNDTAAFNSDGGVVTTTSLTTAALGLYTLTVYNSQITPFSIVAVSVGQVTESGANPILSSVTPGLGQVTIVVFNSSSVAAFNGTLSLSLAVFN